MRSRARCPVHSTCGAAQARVVRTLCDATGLLLRATGFRLAAARRARASTLSAWWLLFISRHLRPLCRRRRELPLVFFERSEHFGRIVDGGAHSGHAFTQGMPFSPPTAPPCGPAEGIAADGAGGLAGRLRAGM
jgi:hypothetical protein